MAHIENANPFRRGRWRIRADFNAQQQAGHAFAQVFQHGIEQAEGFALVFIQRVTLAIGAQPDALAQMIQRKQMFLPGLIENLQQQGFFDLAHNLWPNIGRTRRIGLRRRLHQAFAHRIIINAFFPRPIRHRQIKVQNLPHITIQLFQIPLLGIGVFRNGARHDIRDGFFAHFRDGFGDFIRHHEGAALGINFPALIIHHIIIFQQILADVEVPRLHLFLRAFQGLVDPGVDNRLPFFQAKLLQHAAHPVGPEDAHQIIFQRKEEARSARVPLAAGTAAQLVINAPAFMAFRANHEKPARLVHDGPRRINLGLVARKHRFKLRPFGCLGFLPRQHFQIAAQLNIRAAACHIGRNRHRASAPGLRHNFRFLFMVARIQHLMRNVLFLK